MLPIIGIVLVPGILWGWVFYHAQRYKKVYLPLLLILFIGGMGSGLLALVLNHAVEKYTLFWPEANWPQFVVLGKMIPLLSSGFWFLVGLNEEFAKLDLVTLSDIFIFHYIQSTHLSLSVTISGSHTHLVVCGVLVIVNLMVTIIKER